MKFHLNLHSSVNAENHRLIQQGLVQEFCKEWLLQLLMLDHERWLASHFPTHAHKY